MNFNVFPSISMYFKRKTKAFTLMELLIYSGIFTISAGLIGSIFYTVTRANLRNQVENEINSQIALLEEIFRQKIEAAKGVNSISGSSLELDMGVSTTTFSLSNNTVFFQEAGGDQLALNDPNVVKITSLTFTPSGDINSVISDTHHFAWSENIGWVDFAFPGGNIQVPNSGGELKGLAYVFSTESWISLNCESTDSCSASNYKVSVGANGNLTGWAWAESFGWISFSSSTDGSAVDYGVKVATTSAGGYEAGEFDGYAWSESIGWISFNCKTGGDNQTNICGTSNYRVQDLRTSTSAIKIDITVQYNSSKPELALSRSNSFVFNIITPTKE